MVKIIPLPYKDISPALEDDLRNKFTTIGLVLDQLAQAQLPSAHFSKIALADMSYIEKKLDRFELRNKLPTVRVILEILTESKKPSIESIKLASADFNYILKVLDSLSKG